MAGSLPIPDPHGLFADLIAPPPTVQISRRAAVPEPLWRSLARNISPDKNELRGEDTLRVPLERFLASRNWLASALRQYGCAIDYSESLVAVLTQTHAELAEVDHLLANGPDLLTENALHDLLRRSRFHRALRDFQLRDLRHLLSISHGANYSVPGAGKTTVAYACYETERLRDRVDRLLVVAPLSAFEAWIEEAEVCFDPAPAVRRYGDRIPLNPEVVIVNYQRLAASFDDLARWVSDGRTHLILDEAHRMKRGRNGEWGATCLDLAHLAVRRDVLTGTPAPQHPRDFVALTDFLWPHQSSRILPTDALRADPPPSAMIQLSDRLRPMFVRTKKSELDLPPPALRVELVEMGPLQSEIYTAIRHRLFTATASASERARFAQMSDVVMYLLQASTNPTLLARAVRDVDPLRPSWPPAPIDPQSSLADRVVHYTQYEMPAKFIKLASLVGANANSGRKTLVWSNFVANIDQLADTILAPHSPVVIHGGVKSSSDANDDRTREAVLRRFRYDPDCMVLIANPAAMSEGVSLHETCHDAVYIDRTFNAGQYLQSLDRIHRLGLPPDVETRITFLVALNTVDETVDDRVRVKAERLARMLSDDALVTMSLPDDEAYGDWIDVDDMDALFAHLREADDG